MNKALFDLVYDHLVGCECVSSIRYVFSEFDYVIVYFNGIEDGIVVRYKEDVAKLNMYM